MAPNEAANKLIRISPQRKIACNTSTSPRHVDSRGNLPSDLFKFDGCIDPESTDVDRSDQTDSAAAIWTAEKFRRSIPPRGDSRLHLLRLLCKPSMETPSRQVCSTLIEC